MSLGEQMVDAVQVHADDFGDSRYIIVVLVKETNDNSRFITSISQHGDCQKLLLGDTLQKGECPFSRFILPPYTDFDCRGQKSIECHDKPTQWFLCRLETMLSMIQVFQPPTVNLRLVIGLCTLIEYGPEVF